MWTVMSEAFALMAPASLAALPLPLTSPTGFRPAHHPPTMYFLGGILVHTTWHLTPRTGWTYSDLAIRLSDLNGIIRDLLSGLHTEDNHPFIATITAGLHNEVDIIVRLDETPTLPLSITAGLLTLSGETWTERVLPIESARDALDKAISTFARTPNARAVRFRDVSFGNQDVGVTFKGYPNSRVRDGEVLAVLRMVKQRFESAGKYTSFWSGGVYRGDGVQPTEPVRICLYEWYAHDPA